MLLFCVKDTKINEAYATVSSHTCTPAHTEISVHYSVNSTVINLCQRIMGALERDTYVSGSLEWNIEGWAWAFSEMGICNRKIIPDGGNSINKGIGRAFSNRQLLGIMCLILTMY